MLLHSNFTDLKLTRNYRFFYLLSVILSVSIELPKDVLIIVERLLFYVTKTALYFVVLVIYHRLRRMNKMEDFCLQVKVIFLFL